ncbi:MAG TPA: chromate transporter [Actinoplanes sp.]|nr:chromate transporter [Actinoplanes sp.]
MVSPWPTTPGPLIMVVQFVAFLGAFHQPGPLDPWVAGVVASLLTTWVTFVPCFLFILLGAPYVEPLHLTLPDLSSARLVPLLIAVIAAVLIFWRSWSVLRVLGVCAALGLIAGLAGLPGVCRAGARTRSGRIQAVSSARWWRWSA